MQGSMPSLLTNAGVDPSSKLWYPYLWLLTECLSRLGVFPWSVGEGR